VRRDGFGGRSLVGGNLTDQRMHRGRVGGHVLRSDMNTGPAHQLPGIPALLGQHHGDDVARLTSPRRAPRTM
jgi:hypothetical protein